MVHVARLLPAIAAIAAIASIAAAVHSCVVIKCIGALYPIPWLSLLYILSACEEIREREWHVAHVFRSSSTSVLLK